MEQKVQDALKYLESYPSAKKATVAKAFGVSRNVLLYRLKGLGGPNRPPAANRRLTATEEKAICRYIDRLDRINLAVRAEYIGDAANRILKAKASPSDLHPPTVRTK
ncbi:hypothetical protein F5B18DRAFT_581447 [Nemania serpens]|nr:hypothetical protein F5B18DRAFT_581447 [Nemania serpens]